MTAMLLLAHFLALGVAIMVFLWIIFLQRRNRATTQSRRSVGDLPLSGVAIRPKTWLAVRSLESTVVRTALPGRDEFFISPRVNGWVIVTGPGLPDPDDDVDKCFLFLTGVSRRLGHVQFFHMEKFSGHHAWARMDEGCVTRAYAWAGETVWNQGEATLAEKVLGMKCCQYGEDDAAEFQTAKGNAAANIERIPRLAARWSLDPQILHRAGGIAGRGSSEFY
jgi:hypothetical protein